MGQMTRDLFLQVLPRLDWGRFHTFHSSCDWLIFFDVIYGLFFVNDRIKSQPIRGKTNESSLTCWYVFSRFSRRLHTLRVLKGSYDRQLVF